MLSQGGGGHGITRGGHTVALRNDGTVWAWGFNFDGELGDGTRTSRRTPVRVQNLDNITAIASGDIHTVALRNDGTVWAWGSNTNRQLGDGTTIRRLTPVRVQSLYNITAIAAGGIHTVALRNDATAWAWGLNSSGQLGVGTITSGLAPARVQNLDGVNAIEAGWYYTAALLNDGTVWAWGSNNNFGLGDGTTTRRLTPVQVLGGATGDAFFNVYATGGGTEPEPGPDPNAITITWFEGVWNMDNPPTDQRRAGERMGVLPAPIWSPDLPVMGRTPVFVGWFDSSDNRITENTIVPNNDVVYSARWTNPSRHFPFWYHDHGALVPFRVLNGSTYQRAAMERGMNYWNNSSAPIRFQEAFLTANTVYVRENADSRALGLIRIGSPINHELWTVGTRLFRFEIFMHSNRIYRHQSRHGFTYGNVFTSVFAHELGHAAGLRDGFEGRPHGGGRNGSLMNHERNRNVVRGPTAFDIESVNWLYHDIDASVQGISNFENIEMMMVAADYPHYDSIALLNYSATDVVRVTVLGERVERLNTWLETPPPEIDPYNLYTVYTLSVIESFYGDTAPGDIVEIRQLGGHLNDILLVNMDAAHIEVGDELIVFSYDSYIDGFPSLLLNPSQSIYQVEPDGTIESLHPGNDLVLTHQYLEKIADGTLDLPGHGRGWVLIGGAWFYILPSGAAATGWHQIDNVWYHFTPDGVMQTGWQHIDGAWYYLASGGAMLTGWQHIDEVWYYLAPGGAMLTGWQSIDDVWYYLAPCGAMRTGWVLEDDVWYYLASSGAMLTGWGFIGGEWYYFTSSGAMQTGWDLIGDIWYYFQPSGAMATDWLLIDNAWHLFDDSGAWLRQWYDSGCCNC